MISWQRTICYFELLYGTCYLALCPWQWSSLTCKHNDNVTYDMWYCVYNHEISDRNVQASKPRTRL